VSWVSSLEFTSEILLPSPAQFGDNGRVVRCQPIVKFIERLERSQNLCWDFYGVTGHEWIIYLSAQKTIGGKAEGGAAAPRVIGYQLMVNRGWEEGKGGAGEQ
jgi:hypothetical protein